MTGCEPVKNGWKILVAAGVVLDQDGGWLLPLVAQGP
jgi:hypothetical protein